MVTSPSVRKVLIPAGSYFGQVPSLLCFKDPEPQNKSRDRRNLPPDTSKPSATAQTNTPTPCLDIARVIEAALLAISEP